MLSEHKSKLLFITIREALHVWQSTNILQIYILKLPTAPRHPALCPQQTIPHVHRHSGTGHTSCFANHSFAWAA